MRCWVAFTPIIVYIIGSDSKSAFIKPIIVYITGSFSGFCWNLVGACNTPRFKKWHAQFAYYKSPELGLNLSGS